ncbi:MAG: AAA family ATPase [Nitrosopumilus sp.]|nr:AAA family ATPase [Nitrosopumilus sp.]MDA7944036.1 AAA family ATPase [Nitrosopumilus sp.]MDA7999261.1 AAA family ATPase [Nitrosopumilus sp.]
MATRTRAGRRTPGRTSSKTPGRAGRPGGERPFARFTIRNFGPISKGVVDLRPLTIFIGPNNSGKSYAATLIHSVVSAGEALFPASGSPDRLDPWVAGAAYDWMASRAGGARGGARGPARAADLEGRAGSYYTSELFGGAVADAITANFGTEARRLVRAGSGSASIGAAGGPLVSISERITARRRPRAQGRGAPGGARATRRALLGSILREGRIPGSPRGSFYMPGARSGLLEARAAISAGLERSGRAGPGAPLRGTVSDLVSWLAAPGRRPGPYRSLARRMERDLLGGSLGARDGMSYGSGGASIPMRAASSSVSEAAPLLLYLGYGAEPGSLLVIEEPESHLHYAARAVMARYIVRMMRAGLYVLVTTHSPVMVDMLSMHIRSRDVRPSTRRKLGFEPGDYLDVDEVATYVFEGSAGSGYAIKRVGTDIKDGINQDEFGKAIDDLYDISIAIFYDRDKNRPDP